MTEWYFKYPMLEKIRGPTFHSVHWLRSEFAANFSSEPVCWEEKESLVGESEGKAKCLALLGNSVSFNFYNAFSELITLSTDNIVVKTVSCILHDIILS